MKTLIVEDDFLARALLSNLLSQYGSCHLAADGQEAVNAVTKAYDEEEPYDLICLDVMMPVMDGQETLVQIRQQEKTRDIKEGSKVFMITSMSDETNRKKAAETGCQAYLIKPLNKKRVIEELEKVKLI